MNLIEWLQDWYLSNCDGDWEHCYGIKIDNLDNPGWSVEINFTNTDLEDRVFEPIQIQRADEHNWIHCSVSENVFKGYGGPKNLEEILDIFYKWVSR